MTNCVLGSSWNLKKLFSAKRQFRTFVCFADEVCFQAERGCKRPYGVVYVSSLSLRTLASYHCHCCNCPWPRMPPPLTWPRTSHPIMTWSRDVHHSRGLSLTSVSGLFHRKGTCIANVVTGVFSFKALTHIHIPSSAVRCPFLSDQNFSLTLYFFLRGRCHEHGSEFCGCGARLRRKVKALRSVRREILFRCFLLHQKRTILLQSLLCSVFRLF